MDIFDTLYLGTQANQAAAQKLSELLEIQRIDLLEDDDQLKVEIIEQCRTLEGRVR
jgi:hypothetical protein